MSEIPATMRASVLLRAGELAVEERPTPHPAPGEVLVRIGAVGVCGSDVHYFHEGRIGSFVVDSPLVLGHEAGGTIVAVGPGVEPGRVGTRVSLEPQQVDLTSTEARTGHYNLDPSVKFFATPPVDGAFAEYVSVPGYMAFAIPDSVSDEAAALMEPLSVAVAATRKAHLALGQRVLITGAGPIGLMLIKVARAHGASEIVVTDIEEGRRTAALASGATTVLDPTKDSLAGLDVDALLEASGAPPAIVSGLGALRPGGVAVLIGMGPDQVSLPLPLVQERELVLTGVFRYANTWPTAIELVRSGLVEIDSMVTGRFDLDHVREALQAPADPATVKSVVYPSGVPGSAQARNASAPRRT